MRLTVLTALILGCGASHALAADCEAGGRATVTGTLTLFPMPSEGSWLSPTPENMRPCSVGALRGKGTPPPECVPGKKFTASGFVTQKLFLELDVESIRCS